VTARAVTAPSMEHDRCSRRPLDATGRARAAAVECDATRPGIVPDPSLASQRESDVPTQVVTTLACRSAAVLGSVFILSLLLLSPANAIVEGKACQAEPTDQLIQYGDLINCSVSQLGDEDAFRFQGGSGETVTIQAVRKRGGDSCFRLYGPDGVRLDPGVPCVLSRRDYLLQQSGIHTIAVAELGNDAAVRYALALDRIDPTSIAAKPIFYGKIINDELKSVGDLDLFYFTGEEGDTVKLQSSSLDGGDACFRLYGPDGVRLDPGVPCVLSTRDYLLEQSGSHTVVVSDLRQQTVAYALNLTCVSGGCPALNVPDVQGCLAFRGGPLVNRIVRLTQPGVTPRTRRTDVRGCYAFKNVVAGKTFKVVIFGPRVFSQ
jgi:hypothetical protein